MAKILNYNNADMEIISPLTNRATIIGVLNNNWMVSQEPENPEELGPEKPTEPSELSGPTELQEEENKGSENGSSEEEGENNSL